MHADSRALSRFDEPNGRNGMTLEVTASWLFQAAKLISKLVHFGSERLRFFSGFIFLITMGYITIKVLKV